MTYAPGERAEPDLVAWLSAARANHDVVAWATQHANDWSSFWQQCPRGDWLLAVAARAGIPTLEILRAELCCVPILQPYLPDEPAIARALGIVDEATQVSASVVNVDAVTRGLDALLVRCDDPCAHAAVLAMMALVASIEDPASSATFVAATVQAAVMDAGDCAMIQAARFTEHECARLVREAIDLQAIQNALAATTESGARVT